MKIDLTNFFQNFKVIFLDNGAQILITLAILIVLHIVIRFFITRLSRHILQRISEKEGISSEKEKRITTINRIFRNVSFLALWSIGFIIILGELNINIAPILTGLGIFGLALSFGAQNLVRDIISGVFILIENQIRVGDVATINGTGGLVEAINLRTTILRDLEGVVHIFPNGSINTLSNRTKEWSACVLDISIAYKEDPETVMEIMKQVDEELRADDEFGQMILEPIEIFGLDNFAESSMVIKCRIKTQPLKQWAVARQFRLLLKRKFDREEIEIPFPHISVYFGEASKAFEVLVNSGEKS